MVRETAIHPQENGEPDWDVVLSVLPTLQSETFGPGSWVSEPGKFPHFELTQAAMRVLKALHDSGVSYSFDWTAWQPQGERLIHDPAVLAVADLSTLRKLLVMHVRKDRFCEGHFGAMLESGHIAAVLRRVASIRPQPRAAAVQSGASVSGGNAPVVQLDATQVREALRKVAAGLQKYSWLQAELRQRDVSHDGEYQRRFNGFYRVRRDAGWRQAFFAMLEMGKSTPVSIADVLDRLHTATGRVEASFASKLVATLDPSQPVIDSVVLGNLGLRLPNGEPSERIRRIEALHGRLRDCFSGYLATPEGRELVVQFTAAYPAFPISETKMLDLVLWQARDAVS